MCLRWVATRWRGRLRAKRRAARSRAIGARRWPGRGRRPAIAGEAAGGSITGIGSATLTVAGTTTGYDGTSLSVTGGFSDITNLAGTGTLQGTDLASSCSFPAPRSSYLDTSTNVLTFSGFGT